ncbi:hypothetical protein EDD27_1330 [Nonomuraea polychroma]|uniref:Syndecan 1 n=1 Tax=Nonomuraea polychroma TaxID=46176 RepID=A0A438M0H6_9ACTN|nr:hypothetical protein [Nonomuraea polychroma]RVX38998.1 hypothetical protein EDD27_1330 [Nonomuraea polychroma]
MRWPWSRRRSTAPPRPAPEWPSLPPLQRVIGSHPLTIPPEAFAASLAAWQNPSRLAPLAHDLSPDAPSGLLHDLAMPLPGTPRRPVLPAAPTPHNPTSAPPAHNPTVDSPIQRSPDVLPDRLPGDVPSVASYERPAEAPAAAPVQRSVVDATGTPAPPAPPKNATGTALRVPPQEADEPPGGPLPTSRMTGLEGETSVTLGAPPTVPGEAQGAPPGPIEAEDAPPVRTGGLVPALLQRSAATPPQRTLGDRAPAPSTDAPAHAAAPPPEDPSPTPRTPRLGLGAPITATATPPQRPAEATATQVQRTARQRSAGGSPAESPHGAPGEPAAPRLRSLGGPDQPHPHPQAVQPSPTRRLGLGAPIATATTAHLAIQRSHTDPLTDPAVPEDPTIPMHRPADLPHPPDEDLPLPVVPVLDPPPPEPAGRTLPTLATTPPLQPFTMTVQRRPPAAHEPRPTAPRPTAPLPVQRQEPAMASITFTPPTPPVSAPLPPQPVQRTVEAPDPAPPVPEPQVVTPATAPVATISTISTPPAAPTDDDLVKKLIDPLLRRIRAELRLDRERRGHLLNLPG